MTVFVCIQVIMDRLYKGVWDKVNSGGLVGQVLFQFAYKYKLARIEEGFDTPFLNKWVTASQANFHVDFFFSVSFFTAVKKWKSYYSFLPFT